MINNNIKNGNQRESLVPRLSVLALYDGICRSINSIKDYEDFSVMIKLMAKCEENRRNWVSTQRKVYEMKVKSKEIEDNNRQMREEIENIRRQFSEEVRQYREDFKDVRELTANLKNIRDFVTTELSDTSNTTTETMDERTDRLISLVNGLDTILEETEDSTDGKIEFDKSEEFN